MEDSPVLNAEIDIRSAFYPFDFPNLVEVIKAIEQQLPDDRLKVVKQLRGQLLGLYRITSSDYTLYKDRTITVRGVVLPIILRRKQLTAQRDRPGTLVTLYDAFEGRAQAIPGARFNEVFGAMDGVKFIAQTKPQFHKGTRILNGNRYVILEFDPQTTDLGEYIQIDDCRFKINYFGQQRFCYLCQGKHGSTCPEKEKFKELMKAREGRLTHKIYSDSTLRKVNELAMAADVACTSGAGIGQIANLIMQDPDKIENIIIVAGANELRHTEDEKRFQFEVNEASKKLHKLSATKKITLVLPPTPRVTLEDEVKYEVLKETMVGVKSITVVDLPSDAVSYEGIHPTTEGTAALIGLIQQSEEINIVLDTDYLVSDRIYGNVHSYYKVGCRTCDDRAYTPSMCVQCIEKCSNTDTSRMTEIAKTIYERDNPPLDGDYDMKDIMKRSLVSLATSPDSSSTADGEGENKKQRRDVV